LPVNDINEIVSSIEDFDAEFGVIANAPEYSRLLEIVGKKDEASNVLKRWQTYILKQVQIEELREKQENNTSVIDMMAKIREEINSTELHYGDELESLLDGSPTTIQYGSITISEDGIIVNQPDGSYRFVEPEEESYISRVKSGIMIGNIKLNENQQSLPNNYQQKFEETGHKR
jgi:hypothetical protein